MSLADEIINQNIEAVRAELMQGSDVNEIDEYGFTPLIEAAIVDHLGIASLLIQAGADVRGQDMTGNTALHWAAENNNLYLAKLLLTHGADPNAYTLGGQPVLTMPVLRQHTEMKRCLQLAGADLIFAQDFINTKLLGHIFELVGVASLVDPHNKFLEVDFEGFFLEVSLGIIRDALQQFQNHFAARKVRQYADIARFILHALTNASRLAKYQQYRTPLNLYDKEIERLIQSEPLIVPVGYEGHAITFVKFGNIFAKCDRREDSRLFDNIVFYRVTQMKHFNTELIKMLIYTRKTAEFVNEDLHQILGLEMITELKVEAQISGNCSWANVEACIPAIFFLVMMVTQSNTKMIPQYKSMAIDYFEQWRTWNQDRSLQFLIQSMQHSDPLRNACKAEILAAILYQRCRYDRLSDRGRIESIIQVLSDSQYAYLLENYIQSYVYQSWGEESQAFSTMLKAYGLLTR